MAAVSETPEVGEDVGPYRLLFRLGKGGMGEVWAAQRAGASGFSKEVALKLVPAGDTSSNTVVMFMDEARVTAALQHPAIVPTYDLGKAGEHAFIAMEIVRGPSLNVLLKNLAKASAPMSPALVAYIGERIASALAYAYERAELDGKRMKLVHRDVSPQNILLDLHGTVRLSDFGIARTTVQDHLSAVGTMRGKPGYMSPEQARGLPLDDRSDVFCLATVLWECAAVRRLFGGKDIEESIAACIQRPAPRLDELLGDFPAALADLIARGLDKDPAARPKATEFARQLQEIGAAQSDWSTVEPDLAQLIEDAFGPSVFDVDERIKAAIAELEDFDHRPALPTGYDKMLPAASMKKMDAWPALEPSIAGFEVRSLSPPLQTLTRYQRPMPDTPFAMASVALPQPARRSPRWALGLVGVAVFLVAIAATITLLKEPTPVAPIAGVAEPSPAAAAPPARPGAVAATGREVETQPELPSPERAPTDRAAKAEGTAEREATVEGEPAAEREATVEREATTARKPSRQRRARKAAEPKPQPELTSPKDLQVAIYSAITKLEARDGAEANRFKTELTEVVTSGDQEKLARLYDDVRRALRQ